MSLPNGLAPVAVPVLLGLGALYFIITSFNAYMRLRAFHGPAIASVSNMWVFSQSLRGKLHLATAEVLKDNGPLARIGPNLLVTDDVGLLRHICSAKSPYTRSDWYDAMRLDPRVNNVFSERNDKKHNALRAKLAMGYSGKDIPGLEKSIDDCLEELTALIQRSYLSSDSVTRKLDFATIAQYFTMDVLTNIAFGAPFGCLTRDEDVHDYIKTIRAFLPVLELQTNHPTFNKIMTSPLVQALLAPTAEDRVGLGKVIGVAQEVVRKRYGPKKIERDDMLGSFVRHGLTQQEAEAESLLQIIAGADSTATAVRCIFLHITTNPLIYLRLRTEILDAEARSLISSPVVTNAEALKLPYLQACIKEGIRVWPPLAGLVTKQAPPEGDIFNGIVIPGGTGIAYSGWSMHHSTKTFGQDADIYRPERWLEKKGEELQIMERCVECVFGSGRYGCLGKSVAFIELNKVFVQLLRQFDITIINPITPMKSRCNGIFIQQDMFVRVTERVAT